MWFRRRNPNQLSPVANTCINIIFIVFASLCILPVLLVFAVSITDEAAVIAEGFRLFPSQLSLRAYEIIFLEQATVVRAYAISIFTTLTGMVLCVITVCLYAYPLSRQTFKFRKFFMFFLFFTMLFSGGLVASYMVNVNVLGLRNNVWIMILPMSFNAFWVIVMRTFFKNQIPESLVESAKIDGAGEWYAFVKVVLPLSLPGIATVALFSTIGIWNDFFLNMLYIRDTDLYNLQRMIQEILGSITMLREMMFTLGSAGIVIDMSDMPSQTFRMAMCIVTIGPIVLAYPFFQKYFIRGLTIGAIKE
jgi:putative aldouronate transport system permease protein